MISHPLSDGPLPYRKIMDCGINGYREFACSWQTLWWLKHQGGMTHVDGEPVRLHVSEVCVGGHNVLVRVDPVGKVPALHGKEYGWLGKEAA